MNPRVALRMFLVPLAAAALAALTAACSGSSAPSGDDAGSECMPIDPPPATCPSPPPSYNGEIAFIVATHCDAMNCHGGTASGSVHDFTTYKGVHDDRFTFAQQVALCPSTSGGMPPPGYPQPTRDQRLALIAWATVCGAPDN